MQLLRGGGLSTGLPNEEDTSSGREVTSSGFIMDFRRFRKELVETGEKQYFSALVCLAGGSVEKACHISGLSRSRLYAFLQKHNISLKNGSLKSVPAKS